MEAHRTKPSCPRGTFWLLLLLGAALAGTAGATAAAAPLVQLTPTPRPPTPTIPPTPTGLPQGPSPLFGVVIAAESYSSTALILNHSVFNLSTPADCWLCPVHVLDRLGLNPTNPGVLAVYELNPTNDLQFLSDNWEWYAPTTTNPARLWPVAPQHWDGGQGRYVPDFTPGHILVHYAAPHPEWAPDNYFAYPARSACTNTGAFNYDQGLIAPPVAPAGAPPPYTDWKYWICPGSATSPDRGFSMFEPGRFKEWVERYPGNRYVIGNEEEYCAPRSIRLQCLG